LGLVPEFSLSCSAGGGFPSIDLSFITCNNNFKEYFLPVKLKKYLGSFLLKDKKEKPEKHKLYRRKFGLLPFFFPFLLLLILIFSTFAQMPSFYLSAFKFISPKPIVQSSIKLPADVQNAIENLAKQEIKKEQADSALTLNVFSTNGGSLQTSVPVIQPLIDTAKELVSNPSDRAKIRLGKVDRLIQELVSLLTKERTEKAIDRAVNVIKDIGSETDKVVLDKNVQTDREILALLIEQYNRLQLSIQKLEETLPIEAYLKIEDARQKYLVVTATASINAAPNLDAVHNIAIKEVRKVVGNDFAELKAIEIISDFENGLKSEARQKLTGLQKELAIEFEKRMLKLPKDVRNRKLQDYIKYSFGNPMRQAEAFENMKNFLTDREMILEMEPLKETAIRKLENRVFEIKSQKVLDKFLDLSFKSPSDLSILAQMRLDVLASNDVQRKNQITDLEKNSNRKIIEIFGQSKNLDLFFPKNIIENSDVLNVSVISQLSDILNNSPKVGSDVKNKIKSIKQKTLQSFVSRISKGDFSTQAKLSYNPVLANADVRILFPAPYAITLLEEIKKDTEVTNKSAIDIAEKSNSILVSDHILAINDPTVFGQYQQFIAQNPKVSQTIQNYVGPNFFTVLSKKKQIIDSERKKDQQVLYEKIQQIVQEIFITKNKTDIEKTLPTEIQRQISKLKNELPEKNLPKIKTPNGINLPKVAKLPENVEKAIVALAKDKIKEEKKPEQIKLDLSVHAKDLGVSEPNILPDNPLYKIKETVRLVQLAVRFDPIARAEELLYQDNQKTLEVAKLIEKSQSQKSIALSLKILDSVNSDFNKLKQNSGALNKLKKTNPEGVDKLVDKIISNGLARQTVLSSIEDKIHGETYVKVEKIRANILRDGVDTLLGLTNQNVQKLVDKLESAVSRKTGSDLKGIKAVELLTEISRNQPQPVKVIIAASRSKISKNLEAKLLGIPKEKRIEEVLSYAQNSPGNPVRQFEAYDSLKKDFKNPQTILLAEGLKDKAVENLKERISEITGAASRQEFVDQVVGDKPQDLKIAIEIETRVSLPENKIIEPSPIVQKVEEIKGDIEQNIIDSYKDKPQELLKTDFFSNTAATISADISDVKVVKELTNTLSRSPEVAPEVIAVAKDEGKKIIDAFIDNISKPQFQPSVLVQEGAFAQTNITPLAAQILNPTPETLAELVLLKNEVSPSQQAKIDVAITTETKLIEDHIVNQVNDLSTFQTYTSQIKEDPVVSTVVQNIGGAEFAQTVEQKSQEIQKQALSDQTKLEATVNQVSQEVFTSPLNNPSTAQQTLPQTVQQEIAQIKQEVPAEQIPQVTVTQPVAAPSTPVPSTPAPEAPQSPQPTSAPAPAVPAVQAPTESKPAEQPAPTSAPATVTAPAL